MLGLTSECIQIDSRQHNQDAVLRLSSSAQDHIVIISRLLDPTVYSNEAFSHAASRLVQRAKHTSIKILVHNTGPMVKNGHRALELSQRLSSKIEIRTICSDYSQFNQGFLVADSIGYIHNLRSDLYVAEVNFNHIEKSMELMEKFNSIWELSAQDASVRKLCI